MIAAAQVRPPQTVPANAAADIALAADHTAWSPDANDHLVYHLVKFGGQTQRTVAEMLGISQPTVSRIVDRYDRWQAHVPDREGGRLDPAERLRAQRWLTYERNELILASALRIAAKMEGYTDVSKSVIARPMGEPSREQEIRTETSVIDRHGIAARFLRLAFRINMEQLKLVSQEAPPKPAPLSPQEIEEHEAATAAIVAEFAAVERARDEEAARDRQRIAEEQRLAAEMAELERAARQRVAELAAEDRGLTTPGEAEAAAPALIQPVNKMNKRRAANSAASPAGPCTCAGEAELGKFSPEPEPPLEASTERSACAALP
jgi:hypothetical protein